MNARARTAPAIRRDGHSIKDSMQISRQNEKQEARLRSWSESWPRASVMNVLRVLPLPSGLALERQVSAVYNDMDRQNAPRRE